MSTNDLTGKVALVTGGASGMGLASALRFAADGASVVVADLNEEKGAALLASHAGTDLGARLRFIPTNVALEAEVAAATLLAVDEFGQLDIVFNNAGIGGAFGHITELEVEDWDETFAVLVRSVFLGCKYAAKQMIEQGWGGSIINTASVAGITGGGGPTAYSAAKAAVVNMSRAVALELAPNRIRVNAICPGAIDTPLLAQGRRTPPSEIRLQPWPEIGRPDDIAGAARWLAGDDSQFVTGQAIIVDGGLLASGPIGWTNATGSAVRPGYVGMNRGTTGQGPTVRKRPERS